MLWIPKMYERNPRADEPAKIQAGKEWGTGGETYYYEGERFSCYWDFNCRGEPGSLIVSYGNDGGEGYCGKWASVDITEHYA